MTRETEIHNSAFDYLEANHSPSNVSDCQAAMNIAVLKAYIAGAKWADKTMMGRAFKIITYARNKRKKNKTGHRFQKRPIKRR